MRFIGKVMGHCHIESLIGEGSSAQVYKGMHQTLAIPVAIKILKAAPNFSMASHLATYRDRFRREAQLAARLNHEGIVRVLDFGEEMGNLYLVMEYVNGHTLAEYLRNNGPMSEEMALKIIGYLASALQVAHNQNIVHRDIKPGNILITKDGWLKISDLGLAKDLSARDMTNTDTLLGTPHYMAPECFMPGKEIGPSADIYSLGVLFYEMLTGHPPFTGTLNQVISGHLNAEPAWFQVAHGIKHAIPEGTVKLIKLLLSKTVADRARSCQEVTELCQLRLQGTHVGSRVMGAAVGRDYKLAGDSSTFQRMGQFMEKNLGSRRSDYQGRHVLHTTGTERVLIWALMLVFLGGCFYAFLSSR